MDRHPILGLLVQRNDKLLMIPFSYHIIDVCVCVYQFEDARDHGDLAFKTLWDRKSGSAVFIDFGVEIK